jgi:catechol 2,3-dioxygenase-like lactoylglutathione lyase family enzyme
MAKSRVTHLRHVGVAVPDFEGLTDFYGGIWGLKRIDGEPDVAYFAAEGSPEQYIYRVRRADEKRLDLISFGAVNRETVDALSADLSAAGTKLISEPGPLQTPGGGYGFRFFDPDGRTVEVSTGVTERPYREIDARESVPVKISHVVVNSPKKEEVDAFYREKLGFKLSDWVTFMTFLRCNADHHSLAVANGENATLNHVAFEVRGVDEMMRGSGRVLKDGRAQPMWGPGRHYAGDNAFYYFFDPQGNVSEYTAEVEQILDDDAWVPKENPPADQWNTSSRPQPPQVDLPPERRRQTDPGLWVAPPV